MYYISPISDTDIKNKNKKTKKTLESVVSSDIAYNNPNLLAVTSLCDPLPVSVGQIQLLAFQE